MQQLAFASLAAAAYGLTLGGAIDSAVYLVEEDD